MQLYELEVSNYKCLENYGMPLRFGNLNVFIGENDSGKTSLIEVIQILFRKLEVDESMFFDKNKKIKIKARFRNIDENIINKCMTLEKWDLDYYKCISNISRHLDPDVEEFNSEKINFLIYSKKLKKYNFYEDLINFYKACLEKIDIIIEESYEIINIEGNDFFNSLTKKYKNGKYLIGLRKINDIDQSILKQNTGIYQNTLSFFNIHDKKLSAIAKNLLEKQDFKDFMSKYLKHFLNKCENILEEMLNNYNNKKFIFHADGPMEYLADILNDETELIDNVIKVTKSSEKYFYYLDLVKSCYASIIFSNDSIEDELSKIAYLISVIINEKSFAGVKWDFNTYIKIKPGKNYINNYEREQMDKYLYMPETNIIDNYSYFINTGGDFLPLLKVYSFGTEVINDEIPYKIFNELSLETELQKTIEKYYEIMANEAELLIKDTLEKNFNSELNNIGEELKKFSENIKKVVGKIEIRNLKQVLNTIKFKTDIFTNEGEQIINITKKGQGFLRKLQIAVFLYLLDRNVEAEEELDYGLPIYGKDKILLIEEPELHIHAKGQIELINKIKEKIKKKNTQVFLTTHSHYVIKGTKKLSDIYVFSKNKDTGISIIENIKQQLNIDTEIISKLESTLGLETTDILFLKKLILIVEGKHDIAFIKGLCAHPEVNINSEEILFIETKGQSNIDYFIGLGAFLKIKVLIIMDKNRKNLESRERILNADEFKNKEILNSILELNVLSEPDILNYLDTKLIEKYYGLKDGSLDFKKTNSLLKNTIHEKRGYIRSEEIEFFASNLDFVNPDLKNCIIDPIRRFTID